MKPASQLAALLIVMCYSTLYAGTEPATRPSRAQDQVAIAEKGFHDSFAMYQQGLLDIEAVCHWSARLAKTQLRLAPDLAARRAALEAAVKRMKKLEETVDGQFKVGIAGPVALEAVQYWELEAEAELAEASDAPSPAGK